MSLSMSMRQHSYKPGEYIFREGDEGNSLYLIKQGLVSIRKTSRGNSVEIGQATVNQIVGELSFFDRKPRSADAQALSPLEVVEIPFDSLDPIFGPAPDYLKKIMISLAARLRAADDMIRDLKEQIVTGEVPPASTSSNPESDANKSSDYLSEMERVLEMTDPNKK